MYANKKTIILVKIGMKWILTTMLSMSIIVGAIIGLLTFFIFPTAAAAKLDFGGKLLAWLMFVIMYSLIITAGVGFSVFLYNFLAPKLGGIEIKIEEFED